MQIATVKMNMIYKTYTCQFPKKLWNPNNARIPLTFHHLSWLGGPNFPEPVKEVAMKS